MIQLRAFGPTHIQSAYLLAPESKRQAFYHLWIEAHPRGFRVWRESGGMGKVYQRQAWEFASLEEARAHFLRRVREKTNPSRHSERIYRLIHTQGTDDPAQRRSP